MRVRLGQAYGGGRVSKRRSLLEQLNFIHRKHFKWFTLYKQSRGLDFGQGLTQHPRDTILPERGGTGGVCRTMVSLQDDSRTVTSSPRILRGACGKGTAADKLVGNIYCGSLTTPTSSPAHLLQNFTHVLTPQDEENDDDQQQDDGHQAANQDGRLAVAGHRAGRRLGACQEINKQDGGRAGKMSTVGILRRERLIGAYPIWTGPCWKRRREAGSPTSKRPLT